MAAMTIAGLKEYLNPKYSMEAGLLYLQNWVVFFGGKM